MSNPIELERWKRTLLTGPDERFFDVIRSVMGDIQTPFDKHDLLKRLVAYLKKRETRERMLSIISESDAFLLTTIAVLENPTLTSLYRFLKRSMRYLDLHNHLLNLEERMLIFRSIEDGDDMIRLNPLLQQDLMRVLDADLVFESKDTTPGDPRWLRDELLLSVIAFVREKPELFTAGGDLKSRPRREIESRFSFRDTTGAAFRVQQLVMAFLSFGLMREVDGTIEIRLPRLAAFSALSHTGRAALLAGGLAALRDGEKHRGKSAPSGGSAILSPGDDRNETEAPAAETSRIRPPVLSYASAAMLLLENLLPNRSYPIITLERMLLARDRSVETGELERLVEAMVALGLLTQKDGDYALQPGETEKGETADCVVQPNFEATITGQVSLPEGMNLSLGAELRLYDASPVYEITREAVTRRFADGISAAGFIEALERFSSRDLPSNVVFSLKSWEREFLSVRIFDGMVLLVDEDRRHLIEHNQEMSRFILSIPAPGVYLIHNADRQALERALQECGIDQKPAMVSPSQTEYRHAERDEFFGGFQHHDQRKLGLHFEAGADTHTPATDVRTELRGKLDTMDIEDDVREDLSRMIEKGLLLYPEQLEHQASRPREKHEAKGFDYLGKVRIIEQTLASAKLFLEITTRSGGGKTTKHLVRPLELKKTGSDLSLICAILPEHEEIELKVRSMSLVRSVRGSLYPRHTSE